MIVLWYKPENDQLAFRPDVYSSIRDPWYYKFDDRPKLVSRSRLIAVVKLSSNIGDVVGMQNSPVCRNPPGGAMKALNVSSRDRWCLQVASTDRLLAHNIKVAGRRDISLQPNA